jgi:hypothetical protein
LSWISPGKINILVKVEVEVEQDLQILVSLLLIPPYLILGPFLNDNSNLSKVVRERNGRRENVMMGKQLSPIVFGHAECHALEV